MHASVKCDHQMSSSNVIIMVTSVNHIGRLALFSFSEFTLKHLTLLSAEPSEFVIFFQLFRSISFLTQPIYHLEEKGKMQEFKVNSVCSSFHFCLPTALESGNLEFISKSRGTIIELQELSVQHKGGH